MITAATNATGTTPSSLFSVSDADGLGRDAFLKLLVTQIQAQDPFEPLSAREFIAQLAQFSTVEQLQSSNLQLAILQRGEATSQALLLIGRHITTGEDGVTGLVEAVVFREGQPKLVVGEHEVDPGDVVRVW
jgi:flagellar basal-body rod modification protein FlgD